jgi:hypothetical protein
MEIMKWIVASVGASPNNVFCAWVGRALPRRQELQSTICDYISRMMGTQLVVAPY